MTEVQPLGAAPAEATATAVSRARNPYWTYLAGLNSPESRRAMQGHLDRLAAVLVYRAQGWVSIINPDSGTRSLAIRLLRQAHDNARRRATSQDAVAELMADTDPDRRCR